jgi:hypothetical protein
MAHVQLRFGAAFNHRGIAAHGVILKTNMEPF